MSSPFCRRRWRSPRRRRRRSAARSADHHRLFCLALLWACFGTVDIVATASGKIVPSGRTKLIQPFETGVVRAIHVRDGQSVKAGEVLIELDPTMTDAETGISKAILSLPNSTSRVCARRLCADPAVDFDPPAGASPAQIEMHRQFLTSQTPN